jgi:hypothetical protein
MPGRRQRECAVNRVSSDSITRISREVVSPDARDHSPPHADHFRPEVVFLRPAWAQPLPECRGLPRFPYSVSGFNAEPSQSAQRPRANPAAVQSDPVSRGREGRRCVFFFANIAGPLSAALPKRAVRLRALNGDAGRVTIFVSVQECPPRNPFPVRRARLAPFFPPRRLVVEDAGLSIRATPVQMTRSVRGLAPHLLVRPSAALHRPGWPIFP